MANGVIPPPGGASPLPQVTDAQGWGEEEAGGGTPRRGASSGSPWDPEIQGWIWAGWGCGERGGLLLFFSDLLTFLPNPGILGC